MGKVAVIFSLYKKKLFYVNPKNKILTHFKMSEGMHMYLLNE